MGTRTARPYEFAEKADYFCKPRSPHPSARLHFIKTLIFVARIHLLRWRRLRLCANPTAVRHRAARNINRLSKIIVARHQKRSWSHDYAL